MDNETVTAAEKPLNKFTVGTRVEHRGLTYEIIDLFFGNKSRRWLYDLKETDGDGTIFNAPEDELTVALYDGKRQTIYVVTASGCTFSTEVRIAYDEDEANEVAGELLAELKMEGPETEETGRGQWKGFSASANCEVEIEIHEREIERR